MSILGSKRGLRKPRPFRGIYSGFYQISYGSIMGVPKPPMRGFLHPRLRGFLHPLKIIHSFVIVICIGGSCTPYRVGWRIRVDLDHTQHKAAFLTRPFRALKVAERHQPLDRLPHVLAIEPRALRDDALPCKAARADTARQAAPVSRADLEKARAEGYAQGKAAIRASIKTVLASPDSRGVEREALQALAAGANADRILGDIADRGMLASEMRKRFEGGAA